MDIDLSLEETIKLDRIAKKKARANSSRGRGRGAARGVARGGRGAARGRGARPRQQGGFASRAGVGKFQSMPQPVPLAPAVAIERARIQAQTAAAKNTANALTKSTRLLCSNMKNVTDTDMKELFETIGPIKSATVHFDGKGNCIGTAEVIFRRPGDAQKAFETYNGQCLDGRPFKLTIVTETSRVSAIERITVNPQQSQPIVPLTGRIGRPQRRPTPYEFGVRNGGVRVGPSRGPRGGVSRGRGAARGRGAPRGVGSRRGRGGRTKKPEPTADELDKEMDSYFATS